VARQQAQEYDFVTLALLRTTARNTCHTALVEEFGEEIKNDSLDDKSDE